MVHTPLQLVLTVRHLCWTERHNISRRSKLSSRYCVPSHPRPLSGDARRFWIDSGALIGCGRDTVSYRQSRVYDSVLPRLDSLVTRLFALLSVEHMDEVTPSQEQPSLRLLYALTPWQIVPELQRRLLVDTDVSRHELEEPHSHDMRRRNRSRSPRGRRTRDSPGRSSRQSEDSHCSTCSSSTHTETSPRKSSPSRSEDVYAHKPTGPSSSSSYPPSSADDGTDDKPAADTRGASGPWAGTVTESTYYSEPSVRHYGELSAAPL